MSALAQEFNSSIDEIEAGTSGAIANVIKKLRENEITTFESGTGGASGELMINLIQSLDLRTQQRDVEIEKTCSHHYEVFADSTGELLQIKNEATKMQSELRSIDSDLVSAIKNFSSSCDELSDCKVLLGRIDQCIEALQLAIPVLGQYSRIEHSIADDRCYHALKTLEDLEHNQLDTVRAFAFSENINRRIPILRSVIKDRSLDELTDFLESIRDSVDIGLSAMAELAKSTGVDIKLLTVAGYSSPPPPSASSPTSSSFMAEIGLGSDARSGQVPSEFDRMLSEMNELKSIVEGHRNTFLPDQSLSMGNRSSSSGLSRTATLLFNCEHPIDFGPFFRCRHIHSVLDASAEFERNYCIQRRKQCLVNLDITSKQQNPSNYRNYFAGICGFFVIDDYLRHSIPDSRLYLSHLDDCWTVTSQRITDFVRNQVLECRSAQSLLFLKDFVLLFVRTMQSLRFPTASLNEAITLIFDQHSVTSYWKQRFQAIISADNFSPMTIEDREGWTKFITTYPPGDSAEYKPLPFPRCLGFSLMVPQLYESMADYIAFCRKFVFNTDTAYSEVQSNVEQSFNQLIVECLVPTLEKHIASSRNNLTCLALYSTNLEQLDVAIRFLKTLQASDRESGPDVNFATGNQDLLDSSSTNQSPTAINDLRANVEQVICDYMKRRCNELMTQAFNELQSDSAPSSGAKPSESAIQLTSWLSSAFTSFDNLPVKVAHSACFAVCNHIARRFREVIFGSQSLKISLDQFHQLRADLIQCESFVKSNPVPGLSSDVLLTIFTESHQLLNLVCDDEWETYIQNRQARAARYNQVTPSLAIKMLERMKSTEKKRSGLIPGFLKGRDQFKRINELINQLRGVN